MTRPIASKNSLPGEAPGAKLARLVRQYVGCSLSFRRDELAKLVARGVDDPVRAVTVATNCGTSAIGIMAEAGVEHALLDRPYLSKLGIAPGANAIAWLRTIGTELGALVKLPRPGVFGAERPKPGSLLRYNTAGKNDDHVEWLLSELDAKDQGEHAGGGRKDNAITLGKDRVILWNYGRPLVEFWDPDKLGIEVLLATSDMNEAYPDA